MPNEFHTSKILLKLEEREKNIINKCLYAHGLVYNATLKELKKRTRLYHESEVSKLSYDTVENKEKKYIELEKLGLSLFDANRIAQAYWHSSGNHLLDSVTVYCTAQRAWEAIEAYVHTGKSRPNSKNPAHNDTVMGNGSAANLRLVCNKNRISLGNNKVKRIAKNQWKPETLALKDKNKLAEQAKDIYDLYVNWSGRMHKAHFQVNWSRWSQPRRDFFLENLEHLRNVGITRDKVNGEWKYFVILGINTAPYRKEIYAKTGLSLGIDTGPAYSYGTASDGEKITFQASKGAIKQAKRLQAQKAAKQRKLDRSLRINFPENYNEDGTNKKGAKFDKTKYSKNANRIISELREINRKQAISKIGISREQVRQIVSDYDYIVMENINYSVWARRYPQAMRLHTPGRFQTLLQAELKIHKKDLKILPLQYAFSQSCLCGNKVKKTLKQRVHVCGYKDCPLYDIEYHRDHYSALLMLLVQEYDLSVKELHAGMILKKLKREFNRLKKQGTVNTNLVFKDFRELSTVQSDSIMGKGSRILPVSRVLASIEVGTEPGGAESTPVVEVRLGQVESHPVEQARIDLFNGSGQQKQRSGISLFDQPPRGFPIPSV